MTKKKKQVYQFASPWKDVGVNPHELTRPPKPRKQKYIGYLPEAKECRATMPGFERPKYNPFLTVRGD